MDCRASALAWAIASVNTEASAVALRAVRWAVDQLCGHLRLAFYMVCLATVWLGVGIFVSGAVWNLDGNSRQVVVSVAPIGEAGGDGFLIDVSLSHVEFEACVS